jgi:nucleoside-diphosphate-sugar epimerase
MTEEKTAFVTGGTGFLGLHIIEQLIDAGWSVTAMHRASADISRLTKTGVTLVTGDVTDKASLEAIVPDNLDAIFHAAADTSQWSGNNQRQDAVNITGTANMLWVAKAKRAGRFIYTSSISAYGRRDAVIDETHPSVSVNSPNNYERSKYAAEQQVKAACADGLDAVILNPTAITGPGDTNNWARSFFIARDGGIPGAPSGATSMCDVRDVATAHLAAYDRGRSGENYLLGGKAVPYRAMLEEISRVAGIEVSLRPVPKVAMTIFAQWKALVARMTGIEPDITPEIARMMDARMECTPAKAQRELGYVDRDWKSSLEDSFNWLVEEGLFDPTPDR